MPTFEVGDGVVFERNGILTSAIVNEVHGSQKHQEKPGVMRTLLSVTWGNILSVVWDDQVIRHVKNDSRQTRLLQGQLIWQAIVGVMMLAYYAEEMAHRAQCNRMHERGWNL
jgi:hypothetical protein